MSALAAASVAAAVHVLVTGPDPETERRLRDSFERIPECLRGAMDGGALQVVPGTLNATFRIEEERTIDDVLRSGAITPDEARRSRAVPTISVVSRLLLEAERLEDEAALAPESCALPDEFEPLFGDLDRILLHEVAHAFHYDAGSGGPRIEVDAFLDLRWRDAYAAWSEDPERAEIQADYYAARQAVRDRLAAGREPTPAQLQAVCALQEELAAKYGRMPSRVPGDFHAFSARNGAEYFAMAIETLAFAPEIFCRIYSPEEIAWLKDVLGFCLSQLKKRAACYDAMPAAPTAPQPARSTEKPSGAGIRRD